MKTVQEIDKMYQEFGRTPMGDPVSVGHAIADLFCLVGGIVKHLEPKPLPGMLVRSDEDLRNEGIVLGLMKAREILCLSTGFNSAVEKIEAAVTRVTGGGKL